MLFNVKKVICIVLLALIALSALPALEMTTEIEDFQMHPDFWAGFLPSYIAYKFNFHLLELIPDRNTEVSVTLSTGIIPRTITQNPVNGDPLWIWRSNPTVPVPEYDDPATTANQDTSKLIEAPYDTMSGGWRLKFGQGFGDSVEKGKDRIEVWASFDGQWERALNPILQLDRAGYPFNETIFDYKVNDERHITPDYLLSGTPDLIGDQQMLSMSFSIGMNYNMLLAKTAKLRGIDLNAKLTWAPEKLSAFFSGKADYFRFWAMGTGGYTLFEKTGPSGFVDWSLVLEDELELRVLTGKYVPKFAETTRDTVWGLSPDNMTFFGRNSLKVHYYGKQFLNGMCVPSSYAFLDIGYAGGYINNTGYSQSAGCWTGSFGINIDLQMLDALHIYYELGYIFWPGNDISKQGFSVPSRISFLVKLVY